MNTKEADADVYLELHRIMSEESKDKNPKPMKYIDADKLKAEIERRIAQWQPYTFACASQIASEAFDRIDELKGLLIFITSLQQEQPELPGYDKALLEVKRMVDKLYEEASIGLNEYDSGLYNGIAETCMKLRGFIKARLGSDEQPEVDIEKEIEEWADLMVDESFPEQDGDFISEEDYRSVIERTAIHFLELNARKED